MADKYYIRTSDKENRFFKNIPTEILIKKWGPKKSVKDIQDIHFTAEEEPQSTTKKEIEDYVEKVEKEFHKERKKEWMKGYIQNYITRNPKDMELYKI